MVVNAAATAHRLDLAGFAWTGPGLTGLEREEGVRGQGNAIEGDFPLRNPYPPARTLAQSLAGRRACARARQTLVKQEIVLIS
jgi:hypothetical protein